MTDARKGRRLLAEGPVYVAEAARLLGVADATIRAAVHRGDLPALCGGCGTQFSKLQIIGVAPAHRCLFKPTWGRRYRVVIPRHLVLSYTVNPKKQHAGRRSRRLAVSTNSS